MADTKKTKPFLMVLDFDHTIMDENTDMVVQSAGGVGPMPEEVKAVAREQGWTAFMQVIIKFDKTRSEWLILMVFQSVFEHLHANKVSSEAILATMDAIPFVPGMRACLEEFKALGGDLIIISDSNQVFIDRILSKNDMGHMFEGVFTNPAEFDSNTGVLNITPFHRNDDCKLSGVNLCKGRVLQDYLAKKREGGVEYGFVAYAGDGSNDFCPMLRLGEGDLALARRGDQYSITRCIARKAKEGMDIKARVEYWDDGNDIRDRVKERIGK